MSEAEDNMDRLCDTVNEMLRHQQDISLRLRNMKDLQPSPRAPDKQQAPAGAVADDSDQDNGSIISTPRASLDSAGQRSIFEADSGITGRYQGHFEELLHRSRVYRHNAGRHSQFSLISDARGTLAVSICSSLTLGDVSNISVYALPVYATELSNASCYDFRQQHEPIEPESSHSPPAKSSARTLPTSGDLRSWWRGFRSQRGQEAQRAREDRNEPVFGVPLQRRMGFANLAISLFNDEGSLYYVYGYIPIITSGNMWCFYQGERSVFWISTKTVVRLPD